MKKVLLLVIILFSVFIFNINAKADTAPVKLEEYTKIEGVKPTESGYSKTYFKGITEIFKVYLQGDLKYTPTNLTGFYKIEGETYYLNSGEVLRGLYNIGNKLYAFNAEGKMIKGFKKINNKLYYFNSDGSAIKGLVYIGKARYYFNSDYTAHIGFINLWGYTYYCGSDYLVKTNWQKINNKWYYFNQYGVMQKGFKTISKKMYYFNSVGVKTLGMVNHNGSYFYVYEGRTARNQFVTVSGYKYYFDHRTKAIKGWKTVGKKTYYFNSQYRMQKGFQTIGKKRYHFGNSSGELKKGWMKTGSNWYYFSPKTGEILPGFRKVGVKYYYFDSNGLKKLGFVYHGGNTYYLNNGSIAKGWKTFGTTKYYFNTTNGAALKGIRTLSGKKYYFQSDGRCLTNWRVINGKTYYYNTYGYKLTGKQTIKGTYYDFGKDGILIGGWKTVSDKKYYYDANNKKVTGWRHIQGVKYYFNKNGEMIKSYAKKVIDVSVWQDDINWDTVKAKADLDGVILRIGYAGTSTGDTFEDKKFERNIKEVKRLKIPYTIYIYGANKTAAGGNKEADFVLSTLKKYGAAPDKTLFKNLIFYDAEEANVGLNNYLKVIPAFVNRIQSKSTYKAGVYGNLNALTKGYLNSNSIRKYPIWVAQYNSVCNYPYARVGWQYSSSESVPGIKGNVDMNVW